MYHQVKKLFDLGLEFALLYAHRVPPDAIVLEVDPIQARPLLPSNISPNWQGRGLRTVSTRKEHGMGDASLSDQAALR
jgi:hypothetical protein